jgi:hypothetical protein
MACSVETEAERVVLRPVADTSLLEQYPTNNLGHGTRLHVGSVPEGRTRSLIKFDLSSITTTGKVVFASLKLNTFPSPYPGGSEDIAAFRGLKNWDEGTGTGLLGVGTVEGATWNFPQTASVRWQEPGSAYSYEFYHLISAQVRPNFGEGVLSGMGLAGDVQLWIDQPEGNFGWLLANPRESTLEIRNGVTNYYPNLVYIASREDSELAPELSVFFGNPSAPRVFVDDKYVDDKVVEIVTDGSSTLSFESPYPQGHIFYTLDGTRPTLGASLYSRGIRLHGGEVVRAVNYNEDYSLGGEEAGPISILALPWYSLNYSRSEGGSISIDGYVQALSGSTAYPSNQIARLVATALPGWTFAGWSGDLQSGQTNITVTMNSDMSLKASFVRLVPILTARRIQNEWLLLKFETFPQFTYKLQGAYELPNWTDLKTLTGTSTNIEEIIPLDFGSTNFFYRVVSISPSGPNPY